MSMEHSQFGDVSRVGKRKANFLQRLKGGKLEKWKKKCWERRQKKREEVQKKDEKSSEEWIQLPQNVLRWKKELKVGTWNVRSLLGDNQQELVCSSACRSKLSLIAVQECRWLEIEEGKEMGGYLWYGGGAWKNGTGARIGGVLVGVHKSLEKAVMMKVHRKGRLQLVKLKRLFGRNLIFEVCILRLKVQKEMKQSEMNFGMRRMMR